jgi:hypothetical protein
LGGVLREVVPIPSVRFRLWLPIGSFHRWFALSRRSVGREVSERKSSTIQLRGLTSASSVVAALSEERVLERTGYLDDEAARQ